MACSSFSGNHAGKLIEVSGKRVIRMMESGDFLGGDHSKTGLTAGLQEDEPIMIGWENIFR
jgi:hypothetical protein